MKEGWNYLMNSKKEHYFRNGQSLCKRWAVLSTDGCRQRNFNEKTDCKTCYKELKNEKVM